MMLQNTEEWLKFRESKIGASEANIIMGVSKFSTRNELLKWKINPSSKPEKDNTYITDKGHRLEEKTRAIIEVKTGLDFPDTVAISKEYDFIMASLDGHNEETNTVLECKYVGKDDFEKVKNNQVLEQYYPQIQQQMLVTGSQKNILSVCKENKDKSLEYADMEVPFDADYVSNKLLPELIKFREDWLNENIDTKLTNKDTIDQSNDSELSSLLEEYNAQLIISEQANKKINELKDKIFKQTKHNNVICNRYKITQTETKPRETFDYKKYFKESNIEIPKKYIKIGKPSIRKTIKAIENNND